VRMPVLTVALLLATTAETAPLAIRVPLGKPIMLDGKLDSNGWKDSAKTELPGLATLYVKRSDEYVWLAVKLKTNDRAVDLYLSPPDGSIYRLACLSQARRAQASERGVAGMEVVEQ